VTECRNDRGPVEHLAVGEAKDAKTQALKARVPGAVALEGIAMAVVAEAVGLDDETAIAPEEVDLVWADANVHLWLGKSVAAAEAQEHALEFAAGEVRIRPEVVRSDQAQIESAAHCGTKHRLGNAAPQIAQCPPRSGHRDAVAPGRYCGSEDGRAVDSEAGPRSPASIAGDSDVDVTVVSRKEAPDRGGTSMARDRPIANRKDRGGTLAFEADLRVPHRIHTSV
jgi:hypothetical protein